MKIKLIRNFVLEVYYYSQQPIWIIFLGYSEKCALWRNNVVHGNYLTFQTVSSTTKFRVQDEKTDQVKRELDIKGNYTVVGLSEKYLAVMWWKDIFEDNNYKVLKIFDLEQDDCVLTKEIDSKLVSYILKSKISSSFYFESQILPCFCDYFLTMLW